MLLDTDALQQVESEERNVLIPGTPYVKISPDISLDAHLSDNSGESLLWYKLIISKDMFHRLHTQNQTPQPQPIDPT